MKRMDYVEPEGPGAQPEGHESPAPSPPAALPSESQDSPHAVAPDLPKRDRRHWMPRSVKITLMIVVLFFLLEYILLPELASARRQFHQISHLNFLWLILGAILELAALLA